MQVIEFIARNAMAPRPYVERGEGNGAGPVARAIVTAVAREIPEGFPDPEKMRLEIGLFVERVFFIRPEVFAL